MGITKEGILETECPTCLKPLKLTIQKVKKGILKGRLTTKESAFCCKECKDFFSVISYATDILEAHEKLLKKSGHKLTDYWKIR